MRSVCLKFLLLVVSWMFVAGCGEDSNINSLFVSKKQAESIDVLMSQAEMAYDQGDFQTAKDKAEKAFAINNQNEKVAILLGYIYLSYAGIDPFQLAKSLISSSSKSKTTTETTASTTTSSSSAAGQLGILSSILDISEDDLKKLGLSPCADGVESTEAAPCRENVTTPASFEQFPVLHPKLASAARQSGVTALQFASQAIKTICPFVSADALIEGDPRHIRSEGGSCEASPVPSRYAAKANFLWAFAHIADAIVLYNVLLFTNPGADSPNINARAALVKTGSNNITEYLEMVNSLAKDIEAIFQTDNKDSQINGVLNSLSAAAKAFALIGKGAATFTDGIDKALDSLKTASSTASGASSKVLQSQFTAGVTKTLNDKLTSLKSADPTKYAENKTQICALFDTMSGGEATGKPDDCK